LRSADARVLALLAALCLPIFFWGLGRYGVVNADEAIYHAVAERMVASGDWLRLDFRGEVRFTDSFLNAPLHYFARARPDRGLRQQRVDDADPVRGGRRRDGARHRGARGARLAGARASLLAGLVLLTSFQFVYLHGARTGELDTLVSLALLSIAWLFERALAGRSFVPHHLALACLLDQDAARARAARCRGRALAPRAPRDACAYLVGALAALRSRSPGTRCSSRSGGSTCRTSGTFWAQASGARTDGALHGPARQPRLLSPRDRLGTLPWSAALPFALVAALRDPRLRVWLAWPAALLAFFAGVAKHYPGT
jgi:hypothetical protein